MFTLFFIAVAFSVIAMKDLDIQGNHAYITIAKQRIRRCHVFNSIFVLRRLGETHVHKRTHENTRDLTETLVRKQEMDVAHGRVGTQSLDRNGLCSEKLA